MRVGIVGAGITGLALHHYLRERSVESVVLEATGEPGGVVRTVREDGRVLDLGPQRTRLSPGVRDLIDAAGLGGDVIEAPDRPLYVYHGGELRAVPRTVRGAVSTDLLSARGKLRALFEPFAEPPIEGETVEAFFERAFGPEVARRIAGPLYAGLYGSDPDEMPVEHSLVRAMERLGAGDSILLAALSSRLAGRSPPPVATLADGMGALPRGLYETYADDVWLDAPVRDVRATPAGYELETDGESVATDEVVLTTPAGAAASLLSGIDPRTARRLDRLAYNPLAVVHLHAGTDLEGAGYQIPPGERFATRGVTWNASLFGRDGVYTCFLGGATAPGAVGWPDGRLRSVAAREFEAVTGHSAIPLHVHRVRPGMPAYDRSWGALEGVDPPGGIHLCANYESRAGIPGRVRRARDLADELASGEDGASTPTAGASPGRDTPGIGRAARRLVLSAVRR